MKEMKKMKKMKEEIVFYERQYARSLWAAVAILLGVDCLFIYNTILQVGYGKIWGNNPASNLGLVIVCVVLLLVTVLFFVTSMETIINKEGVYIKIFPFYRKFDYFSWDDIAAACTKKYNPVLDYGGWGWRMGWSFNFKKNRAYTMSGNKGLQLELVNGKKRLIGTQKPEELTEILKQLGKLSE
jgi:hypothetical protein